MLPACSNVFRFYSFPPGLVSSYFLGIFPEFSQNFPGIFRVLSVAEPSNISGERLFLSVADSPGSNSSRHERHLSPRAHPECTYPITRASWSGCEYILFGDTATRSSRFATRRGEKGRRIKVEPVNLRKQKFAIGFQFPRTTVSSCKQNGIKVPRIGATVLYRSGMEIESITRDAPNDYRRSSLANARGTVVRGSLTPK